MQIWKADLGNGTYRNPVLFADYSDPDVARVGDDFYMVASSFTYLPGVPLLHSKDLVNWELINYCVKSLPFPRYDQPAHGCGIWAPSIRFHSGKFYVFIPLPDEGIFVAEAEDPYGEWELRRLKEAKGWIDPCPLWDEDGKAYMVFAYAGSRCGIKHRLSVCEIDPEARRVLTEPVEIFDGTASNPTVEGPKFYKRNGWYYIFAPAGGVPGGWQLVLRSRNIYGPYEPKIVLHQGNTAVNGPHQGGYVELEDGKGAFLHFQDRGPYGRILHLEPLYWQADWPFIGLEQNGDGIGEPVSEWEKMTDSEEGRNYFIASDDDFDGKELALSWQWQANPRREWYDLGKKPGCLRLYARKNEVRRENLLWYASNALTQIPQSPEFQATVKLELTAEKTGDAAGLGILGHAYSWLALCRTENGNRLVLREGKVSEITGAGQAEEEVLEEIPYEGNSVWLRLRMKEDASYTYQYSPDGIHYRAAGEGRRFSAFAATWTGMKIVLAALNTENQKSGGWADIDYITFD